MFQRLRVLAQFEFAETEEGPGRSQLGVEPSDLLKRRDRIGKAIGIVEQSAEIPRTLFPLRSQLQSRLVVADRVARIAGITRSCGLCCQVFEAGGLFLCTHQHTSQRETAKEHNAGSMRSTDCRRWQLHCPNQRCRDSNTQTLRFHWTTRSCSRTVRRRRLW